MTRQEKLQALADTITAQSIELQERNWHKHYDAINPYPEHLKANHTASIKPGAKYVKVDVGSSGKYMVDEAGNIYGIKGYGVIHRGHWYGTLDTIDEYYWGGYTATKKVVVRR